MTDPPKLLDRVRDAVRTRHYSRRTEEAYAAWIRRQYPHLAGGRAPRQCVHAESGAQRAAVSVQGRTQHRDRRGSGGSAGAHPGAVAGRAEPRRDWGAAEAAHGHDAAHGHAALRDGRADRRVRRSARQGSRLRSPSDHRAAREGPQGPTGGCDVDFYSRGYARVWRVSTGPSIERCWLEVRAEEAFTRHGLSVGLVGYAPAPARIHADRPFRRGFAIAFARIHAERCPGVSAKIPGTSVDYGDARRYDEAVVTRGFAGY